MSWREYSATAVAIYPYSSPEENHLNLLAGDRLRIYRKCADWAYAKCETTLCVGVCPLNRIAITSDPNQPIKRKPFDVLVYEAKCLFKHAFEKFLVPTRHPNDNDVYVLDLIRKSLAMLPLVEESREQFAKNLDEIRSRLSEGTIVFPRHRRNRRYDILRTHDITQSDLDLETGHESAKTDAIFPKSVSFRLEFNLKYKESLRLVFRLHDLQKDKLISAPFDLLLPANTEETQVIEFLNIEATSFENLQLTVRALVSKRFGGQGKGPRAEEYVGVSTGSLKQAKPGEVVYINFPFYTCPEGSQLEVPTLIRNQSPKVFRLDDIPSMIVALTMTESQNAAESPRNERTVTTFDVPVSIAPGYTMNSYFLTIDKMVQKLKSKRTRIVVRVLDVQGKKYLPVFRNTHDPCEFCTVVQKGVAEMFFDEIAEVSLDTIANNLESCCVVFEIQRTSRSKGYCYAVAYAFFPLGTNSGVAIESTEKKTLFLIKAQQQTMTANDYADAMNGLGQIKSGGQLVISTRVHSSVVTSSEAIHKLLRYSDYTDQLQKTGTVMIKQLRFYDLGTLLLFFDRLFLVIAELLNGEDESLKSLALSVFVRIVLRIDHPGALSKVYKNFFERVVASQFTEKNPTLASLYKPLFEYIGRALNIEERSSSNECLADSVQDEPEVEMPQSSTESLDSEEIESPRSSKQCKSCCRCLSYFLSTIAASLRLSKEMEAHFDESQFHEPIRNIWTQLSKLMIGNDLDLVSKGFVCRSIPVLRDAISDFLDEDEATELVINFMNSLNKAGNKETLSRHIIRLSKGICDSQFFKREANTKLLIPIILDNLTGLDMKFHKEVCPVVEQVFFAMMNSTASFNNEMPRLLQFLPTLIEISKYKYFVLVLLYFCRPTQIEKFLLGYENKAEIFHKMLELVRSVTVATSPTYIFFVTPSALVTLVSMSQKPEFDFVHSELDKLVNWISEFYNTFLKGYERMAKSECQFFSRVYVIDLGPIAALLPSLLKSVPISSRFHAGALLPLFHLYVHQENKQTRKSICDGFFCLIEADFAQNGNFERSENAITIAMDDVSKSTIHTNVLKRLFTDAVNKFNDRNTTAKESFLNRLNQLVQFMYDLNQFPNEKLYEDERSTAMMSVLQACKASNDVALFSHFASKLYEMQMMMDNKTEAAESLILAAEIFKWNDCEVIGEGHGFPQQPKNQRKISLLRTAIKLFMESEFYERAIDTIKILKDYYGRIECDYQYLADLYSLETKCWECCCNPERNILNRFYGVRFYGTKFSSYFKDSIYIYRRNGFFMNDQMILDLKAKFPDARIEPKPPSIQDIRQPSLHYIYIFNVKPQDLQTFDPYIPPSQLMVKQVCNVDTFYSETPVRKRRDGDYGEFAEWHRHIYTYKTEMPLQGPVRRALVRTTSPLTELSPIECAVVDTNAKTIELMHKACMYWRCLHFNLPYNEMAVSSFSMLMNGIVNAAVNGGTKVFQDLFLEGPLKNEPVNKKFGPALKTALADQLKAVNFALKIHPHVMSAQYQGLHENVVENFEKMREVMEQALGKVDLTEPAKFGEIPDTEFLDEGMEEKNGLELGSEAHVLLE